MNQPLYDGRGVDENAGDIYENIPDGDYLVTVIGCERRLAQYNPSCEFLALQFEICQGELAGRKVFSNFTQKHTNEKAVNIGRARMKQLSLAVTGNEVVGTAEELYAKPVTIRLKTTTNKKTGEPSQNVVGIGGPTGIEKSKTQAAQVAASPMASAMNTYQPATPGATATQQTFNGPAQNFATGQPLPADPNKIPF